MRCLASLLGLVAVLAAMTGCAQIQGRDDCFGQTITDLCLGSPSWATLHGIGPWNV
jgi:hypothetical protein